MSLKHSRQTCLLLLYWVLIWVPWTVIRNGYGGAGGGICRCVLSQQIRSWKNWPSLPPNQNREWYSNQATTSSSPYILLRGHTLSNWWNVPAGGDRTLWFPMSSPVVLVQKWDGSLHFCVDYGKINTITKKDCYCLPRVNDLLDSLDDAQWFSTLDLRSRYWQVEVDPADREKTAFTTQHGHFQFRLMPFGLCKAPSTFQRLMKLVLVGP